MKNLKLIYNPYAGDGTFKDYLDEVINILQNDGGYNVHIFRSTNVGDIDEHLSTIRSEYYDAICISGGDGTINLAVNSMKKHNINLPLGIFPSGTANDFATFIGLPKNPAEAAKIIANGEIKAVDVAKANDKYFINVACVGLFANISQTIDTELKNTLGKLAYFIRGAEALTNATPVKVRITTSKEVIEREIYLALVMNSSGAGGFNKVAPNCSLDDGVFDLVAYESNNNVGESVVSFFKTLTGRHIDNKNVIYTQDNYFKIESLDDKLSDETDVDGEKGPNLPLEINVIKHGLKIFIKKDSEITYKKKGIFNNIFNMQGE